MRNLLTVFLFVLLASACRQRAGVPRDRPDTSYVPTATNILPAKIVAPQATTQPRIDGVGDESCWNQTTWHAIDHNWIGPKYDSIDFAGRYKVAWDKEYLYILAEIKDDTLVNTHKPLDNYWDDDCLTVYLDEDHSGGDHQYTYNAFAYHIGLDGRIVDMGPDSTAQLYPTHCNVKIDTRGDTATWELAFRLFPHTYKGDVKDKPVNLFDGKRIGFAIAYNDNDRSPMRENMIGSVYIDGQNRNLAWITADVFGDLFLEGR